MPSPKSRCLAASVAAVLRSYSASDIRTGGGLARPAWEHGDLRVGDVVGAQEGVPGDLPWDADVQRVRDRRQHVDRAYVQVGVAAAALVGELYQQRGRGDVGGRR